MTEIHIYYTFKTHEIYFSADKTLVYDKFYTDWVLIAKSTFLRMVMMGKIIRKGR